MRESEILERIGRISREAPTQLTGGWETIVGPGDDCAVLKSGSGLLLLTVDQLIEGRHIEPGTPADLIARKSVARSISDIAAMGGTPCWSMATGIIPIVNDRDDNQSENLGMALSEHLHRWALHWGCPMVGGDLASSDGPLSLTVTVGGVMMENAKPLLRSDAKPGHTIYVSGEIGNSLASGRHAGFEPRLALGQRLAADMETGAAMDISDGLGIDASRIARASNVRMEIDAPAIPLHNADRGWQKSISDGEDYELLFTHESPELTFEDIRVTPIGRVMPGEPGAFIVDETGRTHDTSRMGWDHGLPQGQE